MAPRGSGAARMRLPGRTFGIVLLCVLLSACGGDDSTTSPEEPAVYDAGGRVVLPDSVQVELNLLRVVGCLGEAGPEEDGSFTLGMPAGGPAQVCLADEENRLILLGFVDADHPESGEISPLTTAVAFLYRATGLVWMPSDQRADILRLLAETEEAEALAAVIASRLVANPLALQDGDPRISSALTEAVNSLFERAGVQLDSGSPPPSSRASSPGGALSATARATSDLSNITIEDPAPEGGLTVMHNPAGPGIVVQNTYRRHAWYRGLGVIWSAWLAGYSPRMAPCSIRDGTMSADWV